MIKYILPADLCFLTNNSRVALISHFGYQVTFTVLWDEFLKHKDEDYEISFFIFFYQGPKTFVVKIEPRICVRKKEGKKKKTSAQTKHGCVQIWDSKTSLDIILQNYLRGTKKGQNDAKFVLFWQSQHHRTQRSTMVNSTKYGLKI